MREKSRKIVSLSFFFRFFVQIYTKSFSLKTTLLKWKPDYDSAAAEYDRAGKGFFILRFPHFLIVSFFQPSVTRTRNNSRNVWTLI